MYSHHSHSGQYCQHAKGSLEDMVLKALSLNYKLLCLTEHMPRLENKHLYPEELETNTSIQDLEKTFDDYFAEAQRLKAKYAGRIELLVGFESEGISPAYNNYTKQLLAKYDFDMFVGSVHHVNGIPIDFDEVQFTQAMESCGGLEQLYSEYFDLQYAVLQLHPTVLGHFDLIRLLSPEFDLKNSGVWPKVVRNVQFAANSKCLIEINHSAIRKGWTCPYPQSDIVEQIVKFGAKVCLSDDSHTPLQIGINVAKSLNYLLENGVTQFHTVTGEVVSIERFLKTMI
ncbi:putative histidinol-phosphatase [Wickerhamiella sorbophila]|uniref:Histidinol-phosphatase n=1 Tax=Wickerhamiella sorbophila TaxID=45607 RepID=A0A2T0FGA9_9ASCO|nr:putative histidinol-phosphatase [Wickerhamiella sorbophila]PRT54028.1 putative histidinol-phosphatase [Wickerhamiella sorbophila]